MESENRDLEERLKCLLIKLQTESGIFERIVYRGKNQHRRCPYFQALLKVRRGLRLLHLAELGNILNVLFPIIKGTSPVAVGCFPKLSNKKNPDEKLGYHDRLLGVARLLSKMVEPIIKAAIQISLLIAKTFFMGFSLTVLACLARLRVLVQQGLIDVVSVFNAYAALSQKHSLKLSLDGIESCVEYYSTSAIPTLKCVWEGDKFVLHECSSSDIQEKLESFPSGTPIQYQTLEAFDQDSGPCIEQEERLKQAATHIDSPGPINSPVDQSATVGGSQTESSNCERSPKEEPLSEGGLNDCKELLPSSRAIGIQSESRKRVAFVAVQVPKSSETELGQTEKKTKLDFSSIRDNIAAAADPFHDFITNGSLRRTLF